MRRPLFLLSCVALLAAGCPKPQYPECKTDEDCADHGQVCLNGFCKECRDDADCAKGHPDRPVCKDALCTAKPQCVRNEDCGAGMKCAQQKCVPECAADADCAAGHKCEQGRCSAQKSCKADADCGDGEACVQNLCRAQGDVMAQKGRRYGDCDLAPLYFGFDDVTLSAEARTALEAEYQCLSKAQFRRLVLAGHSDERGTTEYNLALGERRADEVRRYLIRLGAEEKKLKSISYGKERPADPAHNEAAWAKNRRVELAPEP